MTACTGSVPTGARLANELTGSLLPRLVSEGQFGAGWQLDDAKAVPIGGLGEDHWASTTLAATLHLTANNNNQSGDQAKRIVSLVAKCMVPGDGFEGYNSPDVQAENEVKMYTKVLPFFSRLCAEAGASLDDLFPKCYLAQSNTAGLLSLTVLEDLRPLGYRLSGERAALDRQHVGLALRALGRMHALSYAAKARCREEFMAVSQLLREVSFTPASQPRWSSVLQPTVMRGLSSLKARLENEPGTVGSLEKLRRVEPKLLDAFSIMLGAVAPEEPQAVIVHGDFCRNNMLFRYDNADQAVDVRLFDLQNSRYCSPVVDLSFFLFMNTSADLRASHWDELLLDYFGGLQSTLQPLLEGHKVHDDFVMPTLQAVREDLKRHALWGFVICSFFLPQMMLSPEEMPNMENMKDLALNNPEGAVQVMLGLGGDHATSMLADMLLEYLDRDLVPNEIGSSSIPVPSPFYPS